MESDGFVLFTFAHRAYVNGVRLALRQRLESAFGDGWWGKGVEYALPDNQLKNLRATVEKNPDLDRHHLIEPSHFGAIIVKHHNAAFADAFNDTIRTFKEIQHLTNLRNEWAHIHDISLPRARQAADLMKGILASLRCEEALEIERMTQDLGIEPGDRNLEISVDYLGNQEDGFDPKYSAMTPLEVWRQLQSYLVLEKSVQLPEEGSDTPATVTIRVHNTAPDSRDWPVVYFNPVEVTVVSSSPGRSSDFSQRCALGPGETRQMEFSFPAKRLVDVEFQVVGAIDFQKLLEFQRSTSLPAEVIEPLRREFVSLLDSTGVKEFINAVLEEIGTPDPDLTLRDINRLRQYIQAQSPQVKQKQEAVADIFRKFSLDRDSTLGSRVREIIISLEDFGKKLAALDAAFANTDLTLIIESVHNLKQIQLAVLRVEDTIKTMTRSD